MDKKSCTRKYKPKRAKKLFEGALQKKALEEENERMINDESERENYADEKEIDNIDLGDDNGHLEDDLQGDEEGD